MPPGLHAFFYVLIQLEIKKRIAESRIYAVLQHAVTILYPAISKKVKKKLQIQWRVVSCSVTISVEQAARRQKRRGV